MDENTQKALEKLNRTRADNANRALWSYTDKDDQGDLETPMVDLLTDMMHLAALVDADFEKVCRIAAMHYEAETNPDDIELSNLAAPRG